MKHNSMPLTLMLAAFMLLPPLCSVAQQPAPIPSELLTDEKTYDYQPSIYKAADGGVWVAWVGVTEAKEDNIYVRFRPVGDKEWKPAERVTATPGQYFSPKLAEDAMGRIWVFYTAVDSKKPATIHFSRRENGAWAAPVVTSSSNGPCMAPSVCVSPGKIWLAWQAFNKGNYDIRLKSFDGKIWSRELAVTFTPQNDWNPVIRADSKGKIWIAWSAYESDQYVLSLASYYQGKLGPRMAVARDGRYNINPSMWIDKKDRVWLAWDSINIPNHGRSGESTITGANLKGVERMKNREMSQVESQVRLTCYDSGKFFQPKILPDAGSVTSKDLWGSHGGKPKVAVDDNGCVYVFHRALVLRGTPKRMYWEARVERFSGGKWLPTTVVENTDGAQEDIGVISVGKDGLEVACQTEHRDTQRTAGGPFVGNSGSNGDVLIAGIPLAETSTSFDDVMQVARPKLTDPLSILAQKTRHSILLKDRTYGIYWGDLHKHSNESGCSQGVEPNPEDRYIYGHDLLKYDFMMLSDHAEHISPNTWRREQELANLFYMPGSFVAFPGYEWTPVFPTGHKNVIFEEPFAPQIRSRGKTASAAGLWAQLKGYKALTIPHTTSSVGMGTDWSEHDPEFQRLAEVFQARRGSCEADGAPRLWFDVGKKVGFVQNALAKGFHLGMICSTDHGDGASYAVVYAERCDRASIFDALYNRRCYGSTAYGTTLEFWSDGHFMGDDYKAVLSPTLRVVASAPVNLRSVEIIKDGKVVFAKGDVKSPIGQMSVTVDWTDAAIPTSTSYYYVRVIREDDEIAWSSPIWVER